MNSRRCLLTVHAHPDDEASKGAGTVARYHAEGVHTVLVTCTGGEEGEILNPAMDRPEVREKLAGVRLEELQRSVSIIGYDELVMLGYRDSGMPDSEANARPEAFANAPLEEAVERLVRVIRRERPQVIITYSDDQRGYLHPDHLRVHEISVIAFDAAGDATRFPDAGPIFQPLKLYYSVWSKEQFIERHQKFEEYGLESPYSSDRFNLDWLDRDGPGSLTRITLGPYSHVRHEALLAHATQIDPTSPFWFGLPPAVEQAIFSYEVFALAKSHLPVVENEDDLFAGVAT